MCLYNTQFKKLFMKFKSDLIKSFPDLHVIEVVGFSLALCGKLLLALIKNKRIQIPLAETIRPAEETVEVKL